MTVTREQIDRAMLGLTDMHFWALKGQEAAPRGKTVTCLNSWFNTIRTVLQSALDNDGSENVEMLRVQYCDECHSVKPKPDTAALDAFNEWMEAPTYGVPPASRKLARYANSIRAALTHPSVGGLVRALEYARDDLLATPNYSKSTIVMIEQAIAAAPKEGDL